MIKKRLYLSDLHMSTRDKADDFDNGHNLKERRMVKLMYDTFNDSGEMWFLGDIFDIEQCDILSIIHNYPTFFSVLLDGYKNNLVKIVSGNHDRRLQSLNTLGINIGSTILIKDLPNTLTIMVTHGDMFDYICKKDTLFQRTIIKAVGYLEYIYPKIDAINPNILQRNKPNLYYNEAVKYGIERCIDIIVMGHTHRLSIINTNSLVKVCSTGCCVNSHIDYITEQDGIWGMKEI